MLFREMDILPAHILPYQTKACRVRAVFFNQNQWINAGAERFGHSFTVFSEDGRVDIDIAKRNFSGKFNTGKYHPRDPEIDNISRGGKNLRRIKFFQLISFFRPTQSGERPK